MVCVGEGGAADISPLPVIVAGLFAVPLVFYRISQNAVVVGLGSGTPPPPPPRVVVPPPPPTAPVPPPPGVTVEPAVPIQVRVLLPASPTGS